MFQKVIIIGGGWIGGGLAIRIAKTGRRVSIIEVNYDAVERSRAGVVKRLEEAKGKGKLKQARYAEILGRISWTHGFTSLQNVGSDDLIIEAVVEDADVKGDAISRARKVIPDGVPIVSVTSAIPLADIGADAGFHPMSPVEVNPGVEIVRYSNTPEGLIEKLREFALDIGCFPFIVEGRQSGFVVNGIFVPYLLEACAMLQEGFDIPTIEAAGVQATGFKKGPFWLMNFTGVPVTALAAKPMQKYLGDWVVIPDVLTRQVESEAKWNLEGDPDSLHVDKLADRFRGLIFANALRVAPDIEGGLYQVDRAVRTCLAWPKGPGEMMAEMLLLDVDRCVQDHLQRFGTFPRIMPPEDVSKALIPSDFIVEYDGLTRIAVVTINRPEAMNALNESILLQLRAIHQDLITRGCRAVILTGAGAAFIGGADIKAMQLMDHEGCREYTSLGVETLRGLELSEMVWIAAVNGYAFGGGLETALACNYIIMSELAKCGFPEPTLGIVPGFDGVARLVKRAGVTRASTVLFQPWRKFTGREAFDLGIANEVVPHDELLLRAVEVARQITDTTSPLAISSLIRMVANLGLSCVDVEENLFSTADKGEGMAAFVEKRRPVFTGR